MAQEISLGVASADGAGALVYWYGGPASIWFGANGHYDFGGGTVTLEISDTNNTGGARQLKAYGVAISKTAIDLYQVFLPSGYYRYNITGSTTPDLEIQIKPGR
jgi:hypothetical protein